MIELRNIFKGFGDRQIIKNVSIKFDSGKTNLIIGKSGSGKTVLLKAIVGLHDVDLGEIIYDDEDFIHMSEKQKKELRKQIGMLFQGGALFDSLTVEENIMFPLDMFSELNKSEKKERVDFCLNKVNLPTAHKLYPAEISGGMKKRVAIARAIVLNPKYLFCDEPNSGLDPSTSIVIDKLIHEITHEFGMTTVIITHDMNSVMEIGDKVTFINQGEKWWEGTKDDILHTDNPELNAFVFPSEMMKKIKATEK